MKPDKKTQWFSDVNYALFKEGIQASDLDWELLEFFYRCKFTTEEAIEVYDDFTTV